MTSCCIYFGSQCLLHPRLVKFTDAQSMCRSTVMHAGHAAGLERPPPAVSCHSLCQSTSCINLMCALLWPRPPARISRTPGLGQIIETSYCNTLSCGTRYCYFTLNGRIKDLILSIQKKFSTLKKCVLLHLFSIQFVLEAQLVYLPFTTVNVCCVAFVCFRFESCVCMHSFTHSLMLVGF